MNISSILPTEVVSTFSFENSYYISIEFIHENFLYILTDDYCFDKIHLKKINKYTGQIALDKTFEVSPVVKINYIETFIINNDVIYCIIVLRSGSYIGYIDLNKFEGDLLAFLFEDHIRSCNISIYNEYIIVSGGVFSCQYDAGCTDHNVRYLFLLNVNNGSIKSVSADIIPRKNAFVSIENDNLIIKYGTDSKGRIIGKREIISLEFLKDDNPQIIRSVDTREVFYVKTLGKFSSVSYCRCNNSLYLLLQRGRYRELYLEKEDTIKFLDSLRVPVSLPNETKGELSMILGSKVFVLKEADLTLKNIMKKFIRDKKIPSRYCARISNILNKS